MRLLRWTIPMIVLLAAVPAANAAAVVHRARAKPQALSDGTIVRIVTLGHGPGITVGQKATMRYTGWLLTAGKRGRKFDASADHGGTFTFTLGVQEVIGGWDSGVAGMKAGGRRTLIVPPAAGYGPQGAGADIPGNATLIFDIELVKID